MIFLIFVFIKQAEGSHCVEQNGILCFNFLPKKRPKFLRNENWMAELNCRSI